jgi:hypothetical protein
VIGMARLRRRIDRRGLSEGRLELLRTRRSSVRRRTGELDVPPADARRAIESATPRPVIPIWTQLSELLQIQLHRALARQTSPEEALRNAAREMNALIERTRVRELMAGTVSAAR